MIEVVENMQKLRDWLDEKNIIWVDASDQSESLFWICRTHFAINGNRYSVVNGFGTYGGISLMHEENRGLLEFYDFNDEPKGYLTAEEVIDIIKELI